MTFSFKLTGENILIKAKETKPMQGNQLTRCSKQNLIKVLPSKGMETVARDQILDEAVSISHSADSFRK